MPVPLVPAWVPVTLGVASALAKRVIRGGAQLLVSVEVRWLLQGVGLTEARVFTGLGRCTGGRVPVVYIYRGHSSRVHSLRLGTSAETLEHTQTHTHAHAGRCKGLISYSAGSSVPFVLGTSVTPSERQFWALQSSFAGMERLGDDRLHALCGVFCFFESDFLLPTFTSLQKTSCQGALVSEKSWRHVSW